MKQEQSPEVAQGRMPFQESELYSASLRAALHKYQKLKLLEIWDTQ